MGILFVVIIFIAIYLMIYLFVSLHDNSESQRTPAKTEVKPSVSADSFADTLNDLNLRSELLRQATVMGDNATYQAVLDDSYRGPLPEKRTDGGYLSIYDDLRILSIAGINFRHGIGKYTGQVNAALVPEPKNEYDPNAIKIVAEDRHHLGYIPSDKTGLVRMLTCDTFPYRCLCYIVECIDDRNDRKFYYGHVYIRRKDEGE